MSIIPLPRAPLVHATLERPGCLLALEGDTDTTNGAEVTCAQCKQDAAARRMRNALPQKSMLSAGFLRGKKKK